MRHIYAIVGAVLLACVSAPAFAACDLTGIGDAAPGSSKADLNTLKNRTAEPTSLKHLKVADVLKFNDAEDQTLEATGVVLVGTLLAEKHEGVESPNCKKKNRRDFHIWIGPLGAGGGDVKTLKQDSIVVELTPNIQDEHPDWAGRLHELQGQEVCITGWLMYDPEHPNQIGATRGTLWEVHPITNIELRRPDGSCVPWT